MRAAPHQRWSVLLALLAASCLCIAVAEAAPAGSWWNTSYPYRQQLTLPAGTSALVTDYSVSVTFNHAAEVSGGRSLASGNDVRVAYWDGAAWQELDRVLDVQSAWNTTTTRIWFKTRSALAANATDNEYFLYYGHTGAGAPPADADEVFLLYDAFDSGPLSADRWSSSGGPTLSGGTLTLGIDDVLVSEDSFPTNTIWETRARMDSLPNGGSRTYYFWTASNNGSFSGNSFIGFIATTADYYALSYHNGLEGDDIDPDSPTSWQLYSFTRQGTSSAVFRIDGATVETITSNLPSVSLPVRVWNDANGSREIEYDWMRVRRYRNPEPTVSLLGSYERYAPVAQWRMEETTWNGASGEAQDSGSLGLHLTSVQSGGSGAVTAISSPARAGNPGTCRYGTFDGANDYLQRADHSALDLSSRVSITVWIYPRSLPASGGLKSILSKDDNYEFHLNSSGQVNWWWGGSPRELTSSTSVPLNQWTHIAITYESGAQRIYINGVQRASGSVTGSLSTNSLPLQIGQDQGLADRFFNGYIDEVQIYNRVLSAAEVSSAMNATYPCVGSASKLVVEHDNYGIHCVDEQVTVYVLDAANALNTAYNSTIRLDTGSGKGTWSKAQGSGSFDDGTANDGIATYVWPLGESSAHFLLSYKEGTPAIDVDAYQVSDSTVRDDDAEGLLLFSQSGFTVTADPLSNPPPGSIPAFPTRITAGTQFDMHVTAYGQTATDPQCGVIESYNGNKSIHLWGIYDNPNSGSRSVLVDGTAIAMGPVATAEASATSRTVTFTNGQASFAIVKYKDVGRISINLKDASASHPNLPNGTRGSTGNIVFVPDSLTISNVQAADGSPTNPAAAGPTGAKFIAAGEEFSITLTSRDDENDTTPNFGRESDVTVQLQTAVLAGLSHAPDVAEPVLGDLGDYDGIVTATTSWSEVGIIRLTPHIEDYLGAGAVTGMQTGNIGRFVPAHFAVELDNVPTFGTACTAYTYVGEPFGFDTAPILNVTAYALDGTTVTQNYEGAYFKLTHDTLGARTYIAAAGTLDDEGVSDVDPMVQDVGNGVGRIVFGTAPDSTIRFDRATPTAPFNANITLSFDIVDADGVAWTGGNPFVIGDAAAGGIAFTDSNEFRYGRINFRNSIGSELLDLETPLTAEYFVSEVTGFAINAADMCTSDVTITLHSFVGNLSAGETCVIDSGNPGASNAGCAAAGALAKRFNATAVGGSFNLFLRAPGTNNHGAVTLRGNVPDYLQYDWDAASPDLEHPTGIATFGIFQGDERRIYIRERY